MKKLEEAMQMLEEYDATGSLRGAAALAGCDHKTVARLVAARDAAGGALPERACAGDLWLIRSSGRSRSWSIARARWCGLMLCMGCWSRWAMRRRIARRGGRRGGQAALAEQAHRRPRQLPTRPGDRRQGGEAPHLNTSPTPRWGETMAAGGESDGHQRGETMATSGELSRRQSGRNRWPLTNASSPVVRFRHRVHCGTALTMARLMSLRAASSLGNCPLVLIAFRSWRFSSAPRSRSSCKPLNGRRRKCQGRDHVFPGVRPRLRDHREPGTPLLIEALERPAGAAFASDSGVDRLQVAGDLLALQRGHVARGDGGSPLIHSTSASR